MDLKILIFCLLRSILTSAQEPSVILNQGAVVGVRIIISENMNYYHKNITNFQVKIYPESSRVPIDAYLGIPYAAAPIGRLRFSVRVNY